MNKKKFLSCIFLISIFFCESKTLSLKADVKIKNQQIKKQEVRKQIVKKNISTQKDHHQQKSLNLNQSNSNFDLEKDILLDKARIMNQISHHLQKHEWHIALREARSSTNPQFMHEFINLVKYANVAGHGLKFNEGYIFDFLSSKIKDLNNSFVQTHINKSTPNSFTQINENNITNKALNELPSNLISRYKKNRSLINDASFVNSVKKNWHSKKFSSVQAEIIFYETFKKIINRADNELRFENCLWEGNFDAAMRLFNKISATKQKQMRGRIATQNSKSFNEISRKLHSKSKADPNYSILLFDSIRWCERNDLKDKKFDLLLAGAQLKMLNKHWHKLIKESKRELLGSKNPAHIELAYHFAKNHIEKPKTTDFVEAEFLAGFIAYKFLNDYKKAMNHFFISYQNSENHNRVSRGAYWIGLCLKKLNNKGDFSNSQYNNANYWLGIGSRNFTTFYGQLCAFEIDQNINPIKKYLCNISTEDIRKVKAHPLYRYYVYALLIKNSDLSEKIGKIFALSLRNKSDIGVLVKLSNMLDMPTVSMHIGNVAKKHLKITILEGLYPAPNYRNLKYNPALVFSIIHKESAFDNKALGLAGEYGLMQLMPDTARKLSEQLQIKTNPKTLLDPNINALLGSQYIQNLQKRFNGFSLLSIGAYNAGENVADRWIKSYGDPRNSRDYHDIVEWVESTSFKTTRYYMQTVMANYIIYQTILNQKHDVNLAKMLFY